MLWVGFVSYGCKTERNSDVRSVGTSWEDEDIFILDEDDFNNLGLTDLMNAIIAGEVVETEAFSISKKLDECARQANITDSMNLVLGQLNGFFVDGLFGDTCSVIDGVKWCFGAVWNGLCQIGAGLKYVCRHPRKTFVAACNTVRSTTIYLESEVYQGFPDTIAGLQKCWGYTRAGAQAVLDIGWGAQAYVYRWVTEPGYAIEQFRNINRAVTVFMEPVLEATLASQGKTLEQTSCAEINSNVGRVYGQIGYEAVMIIGLGLVTVKGGGAGGAAKIAQVLAKLNAAATKGAGQAAKMLAGIAKGIRLVGAKAANFVTRGKLAQVSAAKCLDNTSFNLAQGTAREICGAVGRWFPPMLPRNLTEAERNNILANERLGIRHFAQCKSRGINGFEELIEETVGAYRRNPGAQYPNDHIRKLTGYTEVYELRPNAGRHNARIYACLNEEGVLVMIKGVTNHYTHGGTTPSALNAIRSVQAICAQRRS
jgi:hypothetical protein